MGSKNFNIFRSVSCIIHQSSFDLTILHTLDLTLLGVPILSPDLCLAVDPLWLLAASCRSPLCRPTTPMPGLGECSRMLGVLHADPAVPGRTGCRPEEEERGRSADRLSGIGGGARWEEDEVLWCSAIICEGDFSSTCWDKVCHILLTSS